MQLRFLCSLYHLCYLKSLDDPQMDGACSRQENTAYQIMSVFKMHWEENCCKGGKEAWPFIFVYPSLGMGSSQCAKFNITNADCMVIDVLHSQSLCPVQELKGQLAKGRSPKGPNGCDRWKG